MVIKKSHYLTEDLNAIVDSVIQHIGCYDHPENVLLAILTDERSHIRQLGLCRIIKAWASMTGLCTIVWCFLKPSLSFDAEDYIELIDWEQLVLTKAPVTKMCVKWRPGQSSTQWRGNCCWFRQFPSNVEAVERVVKQLQKPQHCQQLSWAMKGEIDWFRPESMPGSHAFILY